MSSPVNIDDLEAYLDEALPPAEMARMEARLRDDPELLAQLARINGRRDAGVHTLGEIWRRRRISCPSREELGNFLLGVLDAAHTGFIHHHLEVVGCRCCCSNRDDLIEQQKSSPTAAGRRRRYFESSAGLLRKS